jgi:hypothetical protein
MPKAKKRPGKAAKAAKKILAGSDLLNKVRSGRDGGGGSEFRPDTGQVKPADAIKPRPDKKRG